MNRWKIAFWICFAFLLVTTCFCFYSIIDQGVTITYMKQSYDNKENDLKTLSNIVNETDLSKDQIKKHLAKQKIPAYSHRSKDTLSINFLTFIFKDDKLRQVLTK